MDKLVNGWGWPKRAGKRTSKMHLFRSGRSVCGLWSGEVGDRLVGIVLVETDQCAACRKVALEAA